MLAENAGVAPFLFSPEGGITLPYSSNADLPENVQGLPAEAKDTWRKIFNSAYEQYENDGKAAATAWAGLKNAGWAKEGEKWVKKNWVLKSDKKQRYTLGIVYEPNEVDAQNDFSTAEEIEKACWNFTKAIQGKTKVTKMALEILESIVKALNEGSKITLDVTDIWDDVEKADTGLGYMHELWDDNIGDIVENYVSPADFEIGKEKVKKGTWLMGVVWSLDYFEKVENGEVTGLSMGGRSKKIPDKNP